MVVTVQQFEFITNLVKKYSWIKNWSYEKRNAEYYLGRFQLSSFQNNDEPLLLVFRVHVRQMAWWFGDVLRIFTFSHFAFLVVHFDNQNSEHLAENAPVNDVSSLYK